MLPTLGAVFNGPDHESNKGSDHMSLQPESGCAPAAVPSEVLSVVEGACWNTPRGFMPGSLLTMRDGSAWFHPYNGAAPVRVHQGPDYARP